MPNLVLLRHGQSEWNRLARFTGWTDVGLTEAGTAEAEAAGRAMHEAGVEVAVSHTSLLARAIRTAELALAHMGRSWVPVRRHWRLNERHYGALQGRTHEEMTESHGAAAVRAWRRSYDVRPPLLDPEDDRHPSHDPRYACVAAEALPAGECLADVVARMLPYYYDSIVPDMMRSGSVLVTAHGNSIRAMVKHLDGISDSDIPALEIPTGVPIVYTFDESMKVSAKRLLAA
ncbi:MAG: 2,3-diphosphoglycerate-dependent phosphoglycerate mutase [Actinomycetota bacterium]|nr:2,3-diphosphoglycerate-dependent phosphoglycerate mutase [Actinomycetota bacterium]